jgi:hypothetical protein
MFLNKDKGENMKNLVGKTVKLELAGLDGNAFSLMGAFSKAAKREDWTKKEIDLVLDECMDGDYDHLLQTLIAHAE